MREASFEIGNGDFAFLVGPSGAGKTTALKLVPAVERPTSGTVTVSGQNVGALRSAAVPFLRRRLGLVFQEQRLLHDRSVLDNVMLPLLVCGERPEDAARRARAALDKVGLAGRERSMPLALSGGEQQRVCIARAVVNRPAILLADEPTASLDAEAAAQVMEVFAAFNRVGVTVVVATHDQALLERYATRVVRLDRGRVAEVSAAGTVS